MLVCQKSKDYSQALSWLERAHKAYLVADREDDRRPYCEELLVKQGKSFPHAGLWELRGC